MPATLAAPRAAHCHPWSGGTVHLPLALCMLSFPITDCSVLSFSTGLLAIVPCPAVHALPSVRCLVFFPPLWACNGSNLCNQQSLKAVAATLPAGLHAAPARRQRPAGAPLHARTCTALPLLSASATAASSSAMSSSVRRYTHSSWRAAISLAYQAEGWSMCLPMTWPRLQNGGTAASGDGTFEAAAAHARRPRVSQHGAAGGRQCLGAVAPSLPRRRRGTNETKGCLDYPSAVSAVPACGMVIPSGWRSKLLNSGGAGAGGAAEKKAEEQRTARSGGMR